MFLKKYLVVLSFCLFAGGAYAKQSLCDSAICLPASVEYDTATGIMKMAIIHSGSGTPSNKEIEFTVGVSNKENSLKDAVVSISGDDHGDRGFQSIFKYTCIEVNLRDVTKGTKVVKLNLPNVLAIKTGAYDAKKVCDKRGYVSKFNIQNDL